MLAQTYKIPKLPPNIDFETVAINRKLRVAHRYLAELKGLVTSIPNPGILIDTLALQEARASSEIENIVTTQDELFRFSPNSSTTSANAKEVARYSHALKLGFETMLDKQGLLATRSIVAMFQALKATDAEFRKAGGTALINEQSGDTVYVPPQNHATIVTEMAALVDFINGDDFPDIDPLIKMALVHHQFESIHPFSDGNGRVGRMINVLYLVQQGLLDLPVLYLSRYIVANKADYYRLLQDVRDTGNWSEWIIYMLEAVSQTSQQTMELVRGIKTLMASQKVTMRNQLPRIYSQDLLNNIFKYPYTRIEHVMRDVGVSRPTATRYLQLLCEIGLLHVLQDGQNKYFVNTALVALLVGDEN